ncbi:MAG: hypothetical protein ACI9FJ_001833 [Alteromonadaceae bacterium]
MSVSPGFGDDSNLHFHDFRDSYLATFGVAHQRFEPNTFDATMISALAMEHAGQVNNPAGRMIRQSMREVMNPPGKVLGAAQIEEVLARLKRFGD